MAGPVLPLFTKVNEPETNVEDSLEVVEHTIEENKHYDEERQQSMLAAFKQMLGKIIIVFAAQMSVPTTTTELYIRYLFNFFVVAVVAYMLKTWLTVKAKSFYLTVGHYVHKVALESVSLLFDFFVVSIFGLIRSRGEYSIDDVPFVVVMLVLFNLLINIWIRHISNLRFGYFSKED